ncbi:hypothetical protein CSB45_11440 [candidate division KSB3 bacterium]|uniref:Uroporphyrinogen decarboxylase (URO-D) domain-containing protein n=1 Tax=candidate division KSB3 bacterium TaxID=2044937 RepID=A0A2G6E3B7_9BACT|nr:MAG: hypothetical protein CSB45_11440 [candidate division KSB3 bacterium]PIE28924.1 MAG: hypothetical protein CSA57_11485 [candidate division KSB3 bacterium]
MTLSLEDKKEAIQKTWNLEHSPELPFLIEIGQPHFATKDFYDDDDAEIQWNEQYHRSRAAICDYGMPNIKPNVGIGVMAAAFNCEYQINREADPWTVPQIRETNVADVYTLEKPDPATNPIYLKAFARLDYLQQHSSLPLRLLNIPSPLVTASLIWEYTSFIEATILRPKEVHALLDIVTEATIEFVQVQLERIENLHTMGHEMWYIPRDVGLRISDDTASLLSPKTYREFGLRYNAKLAAAFGGIVVHSCGELKHVLPVMMETPGLRGLDITIPQNSRWDVIQEAAAGKTALNLRHFFWDHEDTGTDLLEYTRSLIDYFGRKGIFIQTSTPTLAEAVALGEQLHRLSG